MHTKKTAHAAVRLNLGLSCDRIISRIPLSCDFWRGEPSGAGSRWFSLAGRTNLDSFSRTCGAYVCVHCTLSIAKKGKGKGNAARRLWQKGRIVHVCVRAVAVADHMPG